MFDNNEKKKNIFFIVTIILVMILSYVFFPINHTKAPSQSANLGINTNNNSANNTSSVSTNSQRIKRDSPELSYVIDAQYPEVINLGDEQLRNELNQIIKNYISDKVSDFQDRADKIGVIKDKKNTLNIDYTVSFLNQRLISLKFNIFEDLSNANYVDSRIETFNYDIDRRSRIGLDDVFDQSTDYLEVLSDKIREELMDSMPGVYGVSGLEQNEISNWIDQQTNSNANNFQLFTFDEQGLIFYFNTNKTDFYTLGSQTIKISYSSIKDYLNPTGPISTLISSAK